MVLEGFTEVDRAFANCFRRAIEKGEVSETADPVVLAQLASATLHTIAIRARAQVPRRDLEAIVNGAIDVIVGAGSKS
jgi:TetR/AcrR family transcriptional regulator, copper-responsive repressor